MGKKALFIFFSLFFWIVSQAGQSAARSTSPDGLQLTNFQVSPTQAKVGDTVTVSFVLTNVSGNTLSISPDCGVFAGARWNSTTDANNRDFGHRDRGKKLRPGARIEFQATRVLDAPGVWRFWPAYNVDGHWGPFRWNEMVVHVTPAAHPAVPPPPPVTPPPPTVIDASGAQSTSRDGLQLENFHVHPAQAKVGDTIMVSYVLINVSQHPIRISPEFGVFVGARWNSTTDANNRDFGHRDRGRVLQPGARIEMKAARHLDKPGVWRFWPAYNVDGHWGPFRWNEIVVPVADAGVVPPPPPPPTVIDSTGTQNVSRDGLRLDHFEVHPAHVRVGDKVRVTFSLTNTASHSLTISRESGVFVGARVNSTSDANNRDFGHRDRGRVLQPGHTIRMHAVKTIDEAGTWRFWPAYSVDGHWGPFRWNEIVVEAAVNQHPQHPPKRGHR